MKIEDITNLLYLPLDDERIINALVWANLEIPSLDDNYIVEEEVVTEKSERGLGYTFKEVDGQKNSLGLPILTSISVYEEYTNNLLFGVERSDSYQTVKKKIGLPPKFGNKFVKTMRIWQIKRDDGKEYRIAIIFNKQLDEITSFVLLTYFPGDESRMIELDEQEI